MVPRRGIWRNKDGSAVRYVQLVYNEWNPGDQVIMDAVVHSFGREDQLDRAAVERLAGSLGRLLGQEPAGPPRSWPIRGRALPMFLRAASFCLLVAIDRAAFQRLLTGYPRVLPPSAAAFRGRQS